MAPHALAFLIAGVLLAAGCGGQDEQDTATTATATEPASVDLSRVLLQPSDGFKPREEPITETAPPASEFPPGAEQRLEDAGFVSLTYQPNEHEDGNAGVSSVMVFESEDGARDWLAYETSETVLKHMLPDSKLKRFAFPDIPGARGFTGPDRHGNDIGHIYWTQGRCMLLIGSEGGGDFVKLLSTAAMRVHTRTGGRCP